MKYHAIVEAQCYRQLGRHDELKDDCVQKTFCSLPIRPMNCARTSPWLAGWPRAPATSPLTRLQSTTPPALRTDRACSERNKDESHELREVIDVLLQDVPQQTAEAVRLHHLDGWAQKEVAQKLGCTTKRLSAFNMARKMREAAQRRGSLCFLMLFAC